MTTFFSIDVETTGTDPWDPEHQLATVGAVAVSNGLIVSNWYARIEYDTECWDENTAKWWLTQSKAAWEEMTSEDRYEADVAAYEFYNWIIRFGGEDIHDRVFVANPVTFDHAWIQRFLQDHEWPFSHRTLDLRSASWSKSGDPWRTHQPRSHEPLIPHHALYDAQAQAFDLLSL